MDTQQLFIKMVVDEWQKQNNRLDKLIETFTDEQWMKETAPGRNSGIYLLGHLAAVNDGILPLLGFGEKLHPELENIFLKSPDKSGPEKPSPDTLKYYWKEINAKLDSHIASMKPEDWLEKHSAVSEEAFAKEPHRNKLNILINRSTHQAYHLGQLTYLK